MKREKLELGEIDSRLKELSGWSRQDEKLSRRFEFNNFADSLAFVNKVGEIAETADHHPDITFGWGYAELKLTTHDCGGVTDVDLALAAKINQIEPRR